MSFMQREVYEADYYELDTTQGVVTIPCDAVMGHSPAGAVSVGELALYVQGEPFLDPSFVIEPEHGWIARLSAPGFMDCTEWASFKTEKDANDYLDEYYGDTNS